MTREKVYISHYTPAAPGIAAIMGERASAYLEKCLSPARTGNQDNRPRACVCVFIDRYGGGAARRGARSGIFSRGASFVM